MMSGSFAPAIRYRTTTEGVEEWLAWHEPVRPTQPTHYARYEVGRGLGRIACGASILDAESIDPVVARVTCLRCERALANSKKRLALAIARRGQ